LAVMGSAPSTADIVRDRPAFGAIAEPSSRPTPTSIATPGPTAEPSASPTKSAPSCPDATQLIGTVHTRWTTARTEPSLSAPVIARFDRINPQGAPQVFDLKGQVEGSHGHVWFKALLPMRPNGTIGFIPATTVRLSQTPYHLEVDREKLMLTLYLGCERIRQFPIGLGKDSTPTPSGEYYLASLLKPPSPTSVYGTWAYGLSAYSEAITDWAGGGVVGLHGTNDPSSIGQRESHGCIRMLNTDIEQLVHLLPLGTPIQID
jgi:lipoprotein-anchoring transpeptidase ErfK/SrfK